MTNRDLKPGATVYSQHGQEAEFVAATGGEYIVRPIYEDDDGTHRGDVETWREVFRTPPAPKLDKETADAAARLADLQRQCQELESKKYTFEREERERKERLKLHEELADLDRYLSGQITHYVSAHDYLPIIDIIPVGETMESYSSHGRGMLQLWPSAGFGGNSLRWTVTYRVREDWRSERTSRVYPCCSLDEAQAKVREVLAIFIADELAKAAPSYHAQHLVDNCNKFGIEVPQQITERIAATRRAALDKERADLAAKLAKADADLAALSAA